MDQWEDIQRRQFEDWLNSILCKRNMSIKDLSTGFSDGVALINVLEVLTDTPVGRYCRRPISLMQKLDNVNIAISFVERRLGTSAVGLCAQDIASGNLKQAMGLTFFLIQKFSHVSGLASVDARAATVRVATSQAAIDAAARTTAGNVTRLSSGLNSKAASSATLSGVPKSLRHVVASGQGQSPALPPSPGNSGMPKSPVLSVAASPTMAKSCRSNPGSPVFPRGRAMQVVSPSPPPSQVVRSCAETETPTLVITAAKTAAAVVPKLAVVTNVGGPQMASPGTPVEEKSSEEEDEKDKEYAVTLSMLARDMKPEEAGISVSLSESSAGSSEAEETVAAAKKGDESPVRKHKKRKGKDGKKDREGSGDAEPADRSHHHKHHKRRQTITTGESDRKQLLTLEAELAAATAASAAASSPHETTSPSPVPSSAVAASGSLAEQQKTKSEGDLYGLLQKKESEAEQEEAAFWAQAVFRHTLETRTYTRSASCLRDHRARLTPQRIRALLRAKDLFVAAMVRRKEILADQKRERQRNEVAHEILKSERTYVDSLRLINRVFVVPSAKLLEDQQARRIFSNIAIILKYNELLLSKLEERMNSWDKSPRGTGRLGDIFIELSTFLRVYTPYVNNYSSAFAAIQEVISQNKKFAELLDKAKLGECGGMDLSAFLIMPIQRIPRYVMLLGDMVKYTLESHPDKPSLVKAYQEVKSVADYVNEKKREAENLNQILAIQRRLVGGHGEVLAAPHRRFVRQGVLLEALEEDGGKAFMSHVCFLFNDAILFSRPKTDHSLTVRWKRGSKRPLSLGSIEDVFSETGRYRYESLVELRGAGVFELADDKDKNLFNVFQLRVPSLGKVFLLSCLSAEEKMSWMMDIDENISAMLEKDWKRITTASKSSSGASLPIPNDLAAASPANVTEECQCKPEDIASPEYEGAAMILGSSAQWKPRWLVLKAGKIYIFPDAKSACAGGARLRPLKILAALSAHIARVTDRPHSFMLVTPDRLYTISAQDSLQMFQWIFSIREAGFSRLPFHLEGPDALINAAAAAAAPMVGGALAQAAPAEAAGAAAPLVDDEATGSLLDILQSEPHNRTCADCSSPNVTWASTNQGVFLCTACSTVHRSLVPAGTSEVISIRALRKCSLSDLKKLREVGNARANVLLEAGMPEDTQKPKHDSPLLARQAWIKAKYSPSRPKLPAAVDPGLEDGEDDVVGETKASISRESLPVDLRNVVKAGLLFRKDLSGNGNLWRKYDFVVAKGAMFYRKDVEDPSAESSGSEGGSPIAPRRRRCRRWKPVDLMLVTPRDMALDQAQKALDGLPPTSRARFHLFELVMPMRIFVVAAESPQIKTAWISAFSTAKSM